MYKSDVETKKTEDGRHILYDPDGSVFTFVPGCPVQPYLDKGFLLEPPSKKDAKAVRDARSEKQAIERKAQEAAQAVRDAAKKERDEAKAKAVENEGKNRERAERAAKAKAAYEKETNKNEEK